MDYLWVRNLILVVILIVITCTDFKRREIDNEPIILGLIFISLFSLAGFNNVSVQASIFGFLLGGIVFFILSFWGMGGGDVKLMAMIGFFLGWQYTLVVMYVAFILGAVAGTSYILYKRGGLKSEIPFGPAIALATILTLVYGQSLIAYYHTLIS